MGLPNDSPDARPSLFNDDLEFALLTEHDAILLRMLYDPRLQPGMTSAEVRPLLPDIARDARQAQARRRAPGGGRRLLKGRNAMSIFDFLRGEFIDVIHWTDDTRDTIVWRFEREGHAIKYGAKLTVREGQAAVFVHEGQLADTFGPGLYELETNNLPILTTLQHWDHGFQLALPLRDLLRQHPPLHRPEVGHAQPDHLPRPGVRHGAAARLRHLHHAGGRPGEVPGRDRRHRRRVHHRRRSSSRSATSSSPTSARSSPRAASRCSTWPATPSTSPRSCTSGSRRWSPSTASSSPPSTSRTSRCPPRSRRRSTSAPPPASPAISRATPSSAPPRR